MKNTIIKGLLSMLFLLVVLVGTLTSCKSTGVPLPTRTEASSTTIQERIHDTVFETKKDSSYYKAWLECQDGKVIIREPSAVKGNHLKAPRVIIKDNHIRVDCEAEAQKLLARWKDTHRTTSLQTTITQTVEVERKLTRWQAYQIWCGRMFLAIALFLAVRTLIKIYKPT